MPVWIRRMWLRKRLRDLRYRIEQHDRFVRESATIMDQLLVQSRIVEGELFAVNNPHLFRRAISGVYAPSSTSPLRVARNARR